MNEMQAVADFCAEQPPPAPQRLAAARARVLDEITSARPGTGRPQARRRARLLTWPRLAASGAVAVAAAAAVVTAGGIPFGGGSPLAPPASAAQVLQRAATAALAQPIPQPDQFIYTETRTVSRWNPTTVTRTWTSADGAAQGASRLVPCPAWYDLHAVPSVLPAGWFYDQRQPYRPSCLMALPGSKHLPAPQTYAGLQTLPTDPGALLAYVEAHYQPIFKTVPDTTASIEWDGLRQILTDNVVVPPKLGAAIFRAAATLPGIRLLRDVRDAAGGRGIAVAAPVGSPRKPWLLVELIFDPGTYRFIGSEVVVANQLRTRVPRGTVLNAMAVLRTAITDTAPGGPFNVQTPVTVGPGTWH